MLQKIRENSSGWIAKIILGLIIAVMALFGLEQYLTPKVDNYAAKISIPGKFMGFGEKSREVSVSDFRRRFEQTRQTERQRKGEACGCRMPWCATPSSQSTASRSTANSTLRDTSWRCSSRVIRRSSSKNWSART
jgi:hypothetical protein